jgi:hypothetical protein
MSNPISRRALIRGGLIAGACLPAVTLGLRSAIADAPALDPADPLAKALGYVPKSAKADQMCANCVQYKAGTGTTGTCNIFAGKTVQSGGWCLSWAKKPA